MSEAGDLHGHALQEAANAQCRRPGDAEMPMPPKDDGLAKALGQANARGWWDGKTSADDAAVLAAVARVGETDVEGACVAMGLPVGRRHYDRMRDRLGRLVHSGRLTKRRVSLPGGGLRTLFSAAKEQS